MVDNKNPFTITFNLSQLIKNKEESHLIMLLDETKMTLVYEVMEWIRWIFSIDLCFHFTYNNAIIHSMEKTRILAFLKTVDVKPCTLQDGCCHFSKLDNSVFNKINFFEEWKNIKVPKFLAENLNIINLKLNLANDKEASVKINEFDNSINTDLGNGTEDNSSNKEIKSCHLKQTVNKQITTNNIVPLTIYPCQEKNNTKPLTANSNKINLETFEKEFVSVDKINCHLQKNDIDCSNINNAEESQNLHLNSKNTKEEPQRKKFRSVYSGRPFSVAETLNNLRNSLENNSNFLSKKSVIESGSYSDFTKDEYAWGNNVSNINSFLDGQRNMKKRKRSKRSRPKKRNCEEFIKPLMSVSVDKVMFNNDNSTSVKEIKSKHIKPLMSVSVDKGMFNNDNSTSVKEIKSKHIRFNSNDFNESDSSESDIKPCKILNEEKKSSTSSEAVEILQINKNFDKENSNVNTNEESQNSLSLSQNKKSQNDIQNFDNENEISLENQKFTMKGVEVYSPKTDESNAKNPDCTLMSLKNLFQNPVIIDRF